MEIKYKVKNVVEEKSHQKKLVLESFCFIRISLQL